MRMLVKVRVCANARKESFEPLSPHTLKISVREKPLENAANRRAVELVALHFKVPKNRVRIIRGRRSPSKIFSID